MKRAFLALAMLLYGTVAGLAAEPDWVEHRLGDLGVTLPEGDGWEVSKLEGGGLMSLRVQRNAAGDPILLDGIIFEAQQLPDIFSDWLPVEVATDFLLWEIENMQVDNTEFDLSEIDVYEETHGAQTLHVLRNVKDFYNPRYVNHELEAQELYLVFPRDFAETTTVYKIYMTADCFFEDCMVDDLDLSGMYPLLDDIRDYSAATD